MKQVPLTNGGFALVDDDDFDVVSSFSWRSVKYPNSNSLYAVRGDNINGKLIITSMHRFVLGTDSPEVDHHDGNGLNNCKSNLRPCTHAQNMCNRARHSNNKSGFKGVYLRKGTNQWRAQIRASGKKFHIGTFKTAEAAAVAYDRAASALHGEFARLNFPASELRAI